jgi:hypothetical protein
VPAKSGSVSALTSVKRDAAGGRLQSASTRSLGSLLRYTTGGGDTTSSSERAAEPNLVHRDNLFLSCTRRANIFNKRARATAASDADAATAASSLRSTSMTKLAMLDR